MRLRLRLLTWLGLGLLLAGCADPAVVDGQREIAGELRALRTALQAQQPQEPAVATPPARLDRAALATAMEPLREVLVGLVRDMDAMQTRQTALTEELKRWSQLLAQSATSGNQEEVSALVERLGMLEQQMKAQDTRHREVESLMINALDKTAERLEDFLKRIGEIQTPEGAPSETQPTSEPTEPPKKINGGDDQPQERRSARRATARELSTWWFGVAGAALLAGGMFAFWLSRENRAATATATMQPLAAPGGDDEEGVKELWAAAALLGEAVGRLRDTDAPEGADESGEPAPEALAPSSETAAMVDLDDFFVIEDDPVTDTESGPAEGSVDGPPRLVMRLAAADPLAATRQVLALLAADSRVLRRPEPTATVTARTLEVTFFVLPQLTAGERANIELGLRDSVR